MKTIAIYPGSFNPFHIGHLNIVEKTERIFGKGNVIIAMGINPDKMDVHKSEQFHLKNEQSKELSHKIGIPTISSLFLTSGNTATLIGAMHGWNRSTEVCKSVKRDLIYRQKSPLNKQKEA